MRSSTSGGEGSPDSISYFSRVSLLAHRALYSLVQRSWIIWIGTALKNIGFTLRRGEVLGIAGVAGNGQDELLLALSGEVLSPAEAIRLAGTPVGQMGPNARRALGLVSAPEERLGHAAAPDMSLVENAILSGWQRAVPTCGTLAFTGRIAMCAPSQATVRDFHAGGLPIGRPLDRSS